MRHPRRKVRKTRRRPKNDETFLVGLNDVQWRECEGHHWCKTDRVYRAQAPQRSAESCELTAGGKHFEGVALVLVHPPHPDRQPPALSSCRLAAPRQSQE